MLLFLNVFYEMIWYKLIVFYIVYCKVNDYLNIDMKYVVIFYFLKKIFNNIYVIILLYLNF